MGKTAFIFPGQGAQYVGMCRDFYENEETVRQVFDASSRVTGLDMADICFNENRGINETQYTQVAILTMETALLQMAVKAGIGFDVTAGLSLGEYAALIANGAMDMEDAFSLVRNRGLYMQEAAPEKSSMCAVMGMESEAVEEACREAGGEVSVANYNCPGQIVIAGEREAVARAGELLKEKGCRKVIPLKVSVPSHCSLMAPAARRLEERLSSVKFREFTIPYVANCSAEYVTESDKIADLLVRQLTMSVRWQQSVEMMKSKGADIFVEIGPGKTLSGFNRKIDRGITSFNIEKYEDFEETVKNIIKAQKGEG